METEQRSAMLKAISEVLEKMFFVSVDYSEWSPPAHVSFCDSNIRILDHESFIDIRFRLSTGFARMAAANFLGLDQEQIQDDDVADVMREMANMVGGDFIGRMAANNLQLGIPSNDPAGGSMEAMESKVQLMYAGDFAGVVLWETRDRNGEQPD